MMRDKPREGVTIGRWWSGWAEAAVLTGGEREVRDSGLRDTEQGTSRRVQSTARAEVTPHPNALDLHVQQLLAP